MTFSRLPILFIALALSPSVIAATFHVRNGAAAHGDGSESRPFGTLAQAQRGSGPGDTIVLARGDTHRESISLQDGQSLVSASEPGASPAPRILVREGSGVLISQETGATIEGVAIELSDSGRGFTIEGSAVVRNVALKGATAAAAVEISGGSNHIRFEQVAIELTTGTAVAVRDAADIDVSFDERSSMTVSAARSAAFTIARTSGRLAVAASLRFKAAEKIEALVGVTGLTGSLALASLDLDGAGLATRGLSIDDSHGTVSIARSRIENVRHHGVAVTRSQGVSLANLALVRTPSENGADATLCATASAGGAHLACAAAIFLHDSGDVSLDGVEIDEGAQLAIAGDGIRDLSIVRAAIRGAGDENQEHGIQLRNLSGTFRIAHSSLERNESRQLYLVQDGGEALIEIDDVTLEGGKPPNGAQGLLLNVSGEARVRLLVKSSRFKGNFGNAIHVVAEDSAVIDLAIRDGEFARNAASVVASASDSASLTYRIASSSMTDSSSTPVVVNSSGTATMRGQIVGNRILGAVCGGGCSGVSITALERSASSALVERNEVRKTDAYAMTARAAGDADLRIRLQGNSLRDPAAAGALAAIHLAAGARTNDRARLCAEVGGSGDDVNTIAGAWNASGNGAGIVLQRRGEFTALSVAGYAGTVTDSETLARFIAGNNRGAAAAVTVGQGVILTAGCELDVVEPMEK